MNQNPGEKARRKIVLASVALATVIFCIDILLPLGVAGGVPYVLPVLLASWTSGRDLVRQMAWCTTILTLLGLFVSPPGSDLWIVLLNRSFAILVIWLTSFLARTTQKSESQLKTILETALDYIMVLDLDGNILYVNDTMKGISIDEAIGTSILEYGPPVARETSQRAIDTVKLTGKPYHYELFSVGDDFQPAWYLCCMGPQFSEGKLKSLTLCAIDITDQKCAEQRASQKQTQLDDLLSNVDAIIMEGVPFNVHYISDQVERILGYPKAMWMEHPEGPPWFLGHFVASRRRRHRRTLPTIDRKRRRLHSRVSTHGHGWPASLVP